MSSMADPTLSDKTIKNDAQNPSLIPFSYRKFDINQVVPAEFKDVNIKWNKVKSAFEGDE